MENLSSNFWIIPLYLLSNLSFLFNLVCTPCTPLLVAVEDEKIVGHILFTKAVVQGGEVLALAPLSVLPDYQNRGIGLSLMKEGHSIAHKLGYEYSVVLGHSKYYPKAGYIPASECGIKAPFEVDDESFMALNLNGSQNKLNGVIEYDKAFGI